MRTKMMTKTNNSVFMILVAIVVILLVLIFAPLLTIWSLNTLFSTLEIPYTMETWAATVIITGVIQSTNLGIKSRKEK